MTAFEDYINKPKRAFYEMVESDARVVDVPYYCEECERVWSYHHRLGMAFYEDFPKFQPKKKCRECRGIINKTISDEQRKINNAKQKEYYQLRVRARKVEYPLLGSGRISKENRQKWLDGLEEAEANYDY